MGYDLTVYPNLKTWYEKLQTLPSFDEQLSGAKALASMVKSVYENTAY